MSKVKEICRDDGSHYSWAFRCPGCGRMHEVTDLWTFNGDMSRPTIRASVLVYGLDVPASETHDGQPYHRPRCHSFVTDGRIEFLGDSTHALAGQTVDLPEWTEEGAYG